MLNKQSIAHGTVNLRSLDGLHRTIWEVILGKWSERGGHFPKILGRCPGDPSVYHRLTSTMPVAASISS